MDVSCLVNAANVDVFDSGALMTMMNLVTTLGRWQRKNMTTVEMRMIARLQSLDCCVALLSRSLSDWGGMNDDVVFFVKPVVELLLVLVFPISSRQRRLLKLLEQMSFMVGERGKHMWKRNEKRYGTHRGCGFRQNEERA